MKTNFLALPLAAATALVCSCQEVKMKVETAGDAAFARKTFESLARGDQAVSADIDWKTLKSFGTDVGAAYVVMASEEDQRRFREGFITQFSSAFQTAGGKVEAFGGWKVIEHDATHTVVTAVSPDKILRITVNERDGKERVSGFGVTPL
ncbi:hypothetical protein KBB96_09670 [Luteolibacter ambystomatis]|uniref:Uncharacterized protein n=1 Tax=Luteolibacter ambystomatis TaxID=2824561 RepID=A0A975J359_9BACT|nr:hypothetical protein [Luteolibacter ambystomatis]QUE53148.1 hypothetical protein KBB96_09670 [Luteolibacter ambystomatis]